MDDIAIEMVLLLDVGMMDFTIIEEIGKTYEFVNSETFEHGEFIPILDVDFVYNNAKDRNDLSASVMMQLYGAIGLLTHQENEHSI